MEDYEGKCSACKKVFDLEANGVASCDDCKRQFCPKCAKKNPVRWVDYEHAMCLKCFLKCNNAWVGLETEADREAEVMCAYCQQDMKPYWVYCPNCGFQITRAKSRGGKL